MYSCRQNEPWRIDATIHNIHYAPFVNLKTFIQQPLPR